MVAMPEPPVDTRRAGRRAAIAAGVVVVGLVTGYAIWGGGRPSRGAAGESRAGGPGGPEGSTGGGGGQGAASGVPVTDPAAVGLRQSGRARVQLTDRADRSRVVGLLEFDALEPLPDGRARVRSPRQVVFLRDGRSIELRAATGLIVRQAQSAEPESGVFSGGVEVRLLRAPVPVSASAGPAGVQGGEPVELVELEARTPEVRFDRALSELTARGEFSVSSPALTLEGRGLRLVWNDPEGRPELVVIDQADVCRVRPSAARRGSGPVRAEGAGGGNPATVARAAGADGGAANVTVPPPGRAGVRAAYRAQVAGGFGLSTGGRRLRADSAEVLFTLVDGSFPESELARPADGGSDRAGPAAGGGAASGGAATLSPTAGRGAADVIDLTWTGPLVVKPVVQVARAPGVSGGGGLPPELADDPAWARFGSAKAGPPVELTDERTGARARADEVTYAAGRGLVNLRGGAAGGELADVESRAGDPGAGRLMARSVQIDLPRGRVLADGRGAVWSGTAAEVAGPVLPARSVVWASGAEFTLDAPGGWIGQRLRWAEFRGAVAARDRENLAQASVLRAEMSDAAGPPRLASLRLDDARVLAGRVPASAASAMTSGVGAAPAPARGPGALGPTASGPAEQGIGELRADRLDVRMARVPDSWPGEPPVDLVRADGGVAVSISEPGGDRTELAAGSLTARLKAPSQAGGPDRPGADPIVKSISATGSGDRPVLLTSTGFRAAGQSLEVDVQPQVARLRGSADRPAQVERGGVWLAAPRIVANGQVRDLDATGAGTMRLTGTPTGGRPPGSAEVVWSRSLTVNDARGTARADGDVRVVSRPSPRQTDTLVGERLDMRFTPGVGAQSGGERQLLRAEVLGAAGLPADEQGAAPDQAPARPPGKATAQSRRVSETERAADGTPAVESLLYLEGERIVASQSEGWLEVPGAGRALVDQRGPAGSTGAGAGGGVGIDALLGANAGAGSGVGAPSGGAAGTSLFSWQGGLRFEQAAGVLTLRDRVRLIHRDRAAVPGAAGQPADAEPVPTVLDASVLRAELATPEARGGAGSPAVVLGSGARLRSVTATGDGDRAATLRHRGSRVLATELRYDPLAGVVDASAAEPARVVVEMPGRAEPVTAQRVIWSLTSDRVQIVNPSATIAPR